MNADQTEIKPLARIVGIFESRTVGQICTEPLLGVEFFYERRYVYGILEIYNQVISMIQDGLSLFPRKTFHRSSQPFQQNGILRFCEPDDFRAKTFDQGRGSNDVSRRTQLGDQYPQREIPPNCKKS